MGAASAANESPTVPGSFVGAALAANESPTVPGSFVGGGFSRESTHHDVATINPTTGNHRRLQLFQL